MAMVLLPASNRILEDVLGPRIRGQIDMKEPLDVKLCDFDDVSYHVSVNPDAPGVLQLSMNCACWDQLKAMGTMPQLKTIYGDLLVAPVGSADVTLSIDLTSPVANPEDLIKKVCMFKSNVLGAPIDLYLTQLQIGKASDPVKLAISQREDTVIYFFPKADRCTLVYALDFHQKSDLVIGKVFLNAFVEARRTVNNSPICTFDVKPPMEMRHFNITEPQGTVGFLSITMLKEHVATPAKKDVAVGMLHMLRNYVQYHIKCSKSFFHQRMRARVVALLQVVNRAKPEELNPKAKKTAAGRTFVRDA